MNNTLSYSIAFIGWNPFQFIQIQKLAASLPGAVFVIEKRKDYVDEFSENILFNTEIPILIWEQKNIYKLDGLFDMIVIQTMFPHAHMFKKSKIVMLQYGYAKEVHNYGTWRALADLTLTYGDYATNKISYFCPTATTGNPRYELWHEEEFHNKSKEKYSHLLDKSRKTLLYMPTWGDLSSVDIFFKSVLELSDRYNLLIKLHHNTAILEKTRIGMKKNKYIHYFGATDDALELLSITDIVLSDYSGAIFDAIYCDKPLILLDLPESTLDNVEKVDKYSLEINNRDNLGYRVSVPNDLFNAVSYIEENYDDIIKKQSSIKNNLFISGKNSVQRCIKALYDLMEDKYIPTQMQSYIKNTMFDFYTNKRSLAIMRKKMKK